MTKSPITKEQWQQIEAELKNLYCRVVFDYQGQELSVQRMRTGEGRMDLVVYLDGQINWGWGWPNQKDDFKPEIKAVWRKRSRSLYSPARKKEIIKNVGKRAAKKLCLDAKMEYWEPIFTSAAVLVRQYKKVADLTLKSIGHSTVEAAEPAA
ncbi:hypothetical protein [Oceanospirillum sp.]|uniref:hypothetical protein n=1 Tax=Oceanospirillum sp. TaxID=2021254 RepID=UPI003A925BF4